VEHGPQDPNAPKRTAPPPADPPRIPSPDKIAEEYVSLWHQVARLKDDYDQAEYYRQLHGNRIYALEQELHNLRARKWRREAEVSHLHRGNDWDAAARLVRDEVTKLLANPKCTRRQLREGIEAAVESIRVRGLKVD
jgi:hypothetical protein